MRACVRAGEKFSAEKNPWPQASRCLLPLPPFRSLNKKPFVKDVEEDELAREKTLEDMEKGYYNDVAERMRIIRSYDLNLVDRSDFIIAHLVPDVASWGSAEEIVTAVRMKKPIFISMEGGKKATPLWMMGMVPHHYIYDSVEDIISMITDIDSGKKEIDSDRWRLLKEDLR